MTRKDVSSLVQSDSSIPKLGDSRWLMIHRVVNTHAMMFGRLGVIVVILAFANLNQVLGAPDGKAEDVEAARGHLLLIGGGLRNDNAPVFQKLIALAGGAERAVIGVITTAALDPRSAMPERLARYGFPKARVVMIDVTAANAAERTRATPPFWRRFELHGAVLWRRRSAQTRARLPRTRRQRNAGPGRHSRGLPAGRADRRFQRRGECSRRSDDLFIWTAD